MRPDREVYLYMTPCPQTVQRDATLATARSAMQRFGIRHLPVLDGTVLVGLLSDAELAVAERLGDPFAVVVADAMSWDPYLTLPTTPLVEVADRMSKAKLPAAIIVDRGNVVGVFTAIDALRALADERRRPADFGADVLRDGGPTHRRAQP